MDKASKEQLKLYQSDYTREIEENFAQLLSENQSVRMFFINEDRAFTDGKNIVVDPAAGEIFCDKAALYKTEEWMNISHKMSSDQWMALHMVTRAQSIHEVLHILYTQFPLFCTKDNRATTKIRLITLSMISNIIEDAYIEAVGCSEYDNLELYLLFGRISRIFANAPSEGTVAQVFGKVEVESASAPILKEGEFSHGEKLVLLKLYLEYMGGFLLYPMLKQDEPDIQITEYVYKTRQMFLDGSICGNVKDRYEYTDRIFDVIEELIPDTQEELDTSVLERMLHGTKTHNPNNSTIININSKPREGKIDRKLVTDLNGEVLEKKNFEEQIEGILFQVTTDKDISLRVILQKARIVTIIGGNYDCAAVHKNINIIEKKPQINLNLKKAYQNIYNKYHININSYNSRFTQLLKAQVPVQENKKLFGSGIDSKLFGNVKKEYWYNNVPGIAVPDIAIMLMIDGSGSMQGSRVDGARISSVILHEVLKKQGIEHAIVEHRAIYDEPEVHHNILVDFDAKEEDKYNILTLDAYEGTREGLSLYWGEKYMLDHCSAENRLIIVLSDGVPAHGIDGEGCYVPPVSIKDTANAVRKIIKRRTQIIAIALDDEEYSCYYELKQMYPYVIACTDLKKLTGQILELVTKQFR